MVNDRYLVAVTLALKVNFAFAKKEKLTAAIKPIKFATAWDVEKIQVAIPKMDQWIRVLITPIEIYFVSNLIIFNFHIKYSYQFNKLYL